jgi:hypothetical protein
LCLVPLRPPIRTYKSSPHFRHQLLTNVQWNWLPQNLNLEANRERVTTGPVATYEKSRGRQIGKTFKTAKAVNCNSSITMQQNNESLVDPVNTRVTC